MPATNEGAHLMRKSNLHVDLVALAGIDPAQPPPDVVRRYEILRTGFVDGVVMPHADDEVPGRLWGEEGETVLLPDSCLPGDPGIPGEAHPAPIVPVHLRLIED